MRKVKRIVFLSSLHHLKNDRDVTDCAKGLVLQMHSLYINHGIPFERDSKHIPLRADVIFLGQTWVDPTLLLGVCICCII